MAQIFQKRGLLPIVTILFISGFLWHCSLILDWGYFTGEADLENPGFAVATIGQQHNNSARIWHCSSRFLPFTLRLAPWMRGERAWAALWNLGQRQNIRQGIGLSLWMLCLSLRNLNPRWGKSFSTFLRLTHSSPCRLTNHS